MPPRRCALLSVPLILGWVGAVACVAAPGTKPAPVDVAMFDREVRPLLQRACLGCHGVQARLGGLDLRTRQAALKGGTHGPAFEPGSLPRSLLWQFVSGSRAPLMPPTGKLPATDLAVLKRWLQGGAPWPEGATETAEKQVWWSFRSPVQPRIPSLHSAWVSNPVDAFVLEKLKQNGLAPSPPAARRTLIRRAYLDLIGLPPSPEEVAAFEADRAPGAWEKVVDRLLASPRYGERWGRHWLDLVRYADSSGFEGDKDRPLAWRFRDYVIRAFNQDKPYDAFLKEQLAGDELHPGDPEALVATGYLACGIEDFAMVKLPTTRADELDDLVSTTGQAMLGLTLGCARCHDHKYDPVSQTDYYRLQAIFSPSERREAPIPTPAQQAAYDERERGIQAEIVPLRLRAEPYVKKGTAICAAAGNAKPTPQQIQQALPEPERTAYGALLQQVQAVEARRVPLPMGMVVTDKAREWQPVHLLIRGDAYHPGPVVAPGFLTQLPGGAAEVGRDAATATTTGRRKALAEWLASPTHPLTARVWVNRVWRQHFGRGLVGTPSNFGINGELPTHPELLDWLALRFTAGGWRLKPIHRLILLSSTYRQASGLRPGPAHKDPQNRLLWRVPVRRLEAEAIRDSILAVAGSLNLEVGGPPVYPPVDPSLRADTFQGPNWPEGEDGPKTWRRSVYVKVKRSLIFPQLEAFDCPEITASVAQRNVTTTPSQALLMLNDPLIRRQAALFAARLVREAGPDPARRIERAYRLALGRAPTSREAALGLAFLRRPATVGGSRLGALCHAVLNLSEFIYLP